MLKALRSFSTEVTTTLIPRQRLLSRPNLILSHFSSTMASDPTSQNRPIVISGPSGAGKSTILKRLFAQYPDAFGFSVSHTTRSPRPGEQHGREYFFTNLDDFQDLVSRNGFVEHAQFGGNRYGTSVAAIKGIAEQGRICILDIEMEGVKQMRKHPEFGDKARFLFLSPPSKEVLEQRLRGRGTDSDDAVRKRLDQAVKEMDYAQVEGVHDKIVVNDDLDEAYEEVRRWVMEEK